MNKILASAALALAATSAHAGGELRGGVGYSIGSSTLEDRYGDELSADVTTTALGANYYFGEAGFFAGLGIGKHEVGDFELNGDPLGAEDQNFDTTSVNIGYRGGVRGALQPVFQLGLTRLDSANGDDSDSREVAVGFEKTSDNGRTDGTLSYTDEDDGNTFAITGAYVAYLSPVVGVGLAAGYSVGNATIFGEDVDTTGWNLGIALELRFMN